MTNQHFVCNNNKPKTLIRNQNDVLIAWEDCYYNSNATKNDNNYNYILQIYNDLKEWQTIYWGPKTQYKIKNLAPCTFYNLRLMMKLASDDDDDDDDEDNNWIPFKTATDDGPLYLVRHMTRAIKFGITSLIRKIAHSKPHLLETENKEAITPLVQCIKKGDLQLATFLITLGANVNAQMFHTKRTPLMIAVYNGQLQIASLLINKGCDINAIDINGLTVLHHAVDSNDLENVKFALKLGLSFVDCKDGSGWTPLMRAAILSCKEEIIEFLIANGADKSIKDRNGFDFEKHRELSGIL